VEAIRTSKTKGREFSCCRKVRGSFRQRGKSGGKRCRVNQENKRGRGAPGTGPTKKGVWERRAIDQREKVKTC